MEFKENIIFGFPIYVGHIDPKDYKKENIIQTIEKNYKINKIRNSWDTSSNLHHNYNDWDNPDFHKVDFSSLYPIYENSLKNIFNLMSVKNGFKFEYKIINYTCMSENQFMIDHEHGESDFNAIHYLQLDDLQTGTELVSTYPFQSYLDYLRPNLKKIFDANDLRNSWMFQTWKPPTEEDDFFFMPSLLRHRVPPQKFKNKNRITVVLNIRVYV